jgi:hypothetical protein
MFSRKSLSLNGLRFPSPIILGIILRKLHVFLSANIAFRNPRWWSAAASWATRIFSFNESQASTRGVQIPENLFNPPRNAMRAKEINSNFLAQNAFAAWRLESQNAWLKQCATRSWKKSPRISKNVIRQTAQIPPHLHRRSRLTDGTSSMQQEANSSSFAF